MFAEILQDILCARQRKGKLAVPLLHLVLIHLGRAVIRHGCCLHNHILVRLPLRHLAKHVGSAHDVDRLHKPGLCQRGGTAHKRDLRAAPRRHLRNGIAHGARGMVGDVADGIDGLLRGTGRHKQADAFHVFLIFDRLARPVQDFLRLRHFSGAHVAAGQPAGSGPGHGVAVFSEQG